jgi:hypothetical protein
MTGKLITTRMKRRFVAWLWSLIGVKRVTPPSSPPDSD